MRIKRWDGRHRLPSLSNAKLETTHKWIGSVGISLGNDRLFSYADGFHKKAHIFPNHKRKLVLPNSSDQNGPIETPQIKEGRRVGAEGSASAWATCHKTQLHNTLNEFQRFNGGVSIFLLEIAISFFAASNLLRHFYARNSTFDTTPIKNAIYKTEGKSRSTLKIGKLNTSNLGLGVYAYG